MGWAECHRVRMRLCALQLKLSVYFDPDDHFIKVLHFEQKSLIVLLISKIKYPL